MTLVHAVVLAGSRDQDELRGAERVRVQRDLARAAVLRSTRLADASIERFDEQASGAPIADGSWHWSRSNTRHRSAGVVARVPVGIDVEIVARRSADVVLAATSRDELLLLGGFSWRAFVRVWTAKEAVLKRAGCGLAELSRCALVAVVDDDRLVLAHRGAEVLVRQSVLGRHVAAIALDAACDVEWHWESA